MHFLSTSFKFQLIVCLLIVSCLCMQIPPHMEFFSFLCIRVKQQQALNLVIDGRLFNHFYTSLCSSNVAFCYIVAFFGLKFSLCSKQKLDSSITRHTITKQDANRRVTRLKKNMAWSGSFNAKNEKMQRSHLTMMIFIMQNNDQNLTANTISTCTCTFIQLYCWWFFDAVYLQFLCMLSYRRRYNWEVMIQKQVNHPEMSGLCTDGRQNNCPLSIVFMFFRLVQFFLAIFIKRFFLERTIGMSERLLLVYSWQLFAFQ